MKSMRLLLFGFAFCFAWMVTSAEAQFELVGIHSGAELQGSAKGKTLHTLEVAGSKIYAGYGHYGGIGPNGPIEVRYFDTLTGAFSESLGIANTEAIYRVENIGSTTYALGTDPLGRDPGGYWSGGDDGASWSATESLAGLHFYDMTSYQDDSHLFLAGSGGPTDAFNAMVYESFDSGATWSVALDVAPEAGFLRFYGVKQLNDKLYTQLYSSYSPDSSRMYEFDGSQWTETAVPTTADGRTTRFRDPDNFLDRLIVRDEHSGFRLSDLYSFDGQSLEQILIDGEQGTLRFWDQYVHLDNLYLLTEENTVLSTSNLVDWQVVAEDVPSSARSLVVADDHLYFGTTESSLIKYGVAVGAVSVPETSTLTPLLLATLFFLRSRRVRPPASRVRND